MLRETFHIQPQCHLHASVGNDVGFAPQFPESPQAISGTGGRRDIILSGVASNKLSNLCEDWSSILLQESLIKLCCSQRGGGWKTVGFVAMQILCQLLEKPLANVIKLRTLLKKYINTVHWPDYYTWHTSVPLVFVFLGFPFSELPMRQTVLTPWSCLTCYLEYLS